MPAPNHPQLPLCCQMANQPGRYLFAHWLESMVMPQPQPGRQADACRLKGMLVAYMETDLINGDQFNALCAEVHAFAFGATA